MPYDFRSQRLFVTGDLFAGARLTMEREQANYLLNVLRLKDGDPILLFNGRDGEWRGRIATVEGTYASLPLLQTFERTGDQRLLEPVLRWMSFLKGAQQRKSKVLWILFGRHPAF